MVGVGKPRVGISARLVTGAAILAAVFSVGGTETSWAQTRAPIVYKSSAQASAPTVRLENRAAGMPIAVAPHAPIPTFANSPNPADAFDLRPGVVKLSTGAELLREAKNVIIVPGYGMAVAQAQHALKEMGEKLKDRKSVV